MRLHRLARLAPPRPLSARHFTARPADPPAPPPPSPPPPPLWVARANEALRLQPAACFMGLIASEAAAMASLGALYRTLELAVPLDVAAAIALSRALRRLRVPLNLVAAAGLARAYPPFALVRIPAIQLSGSRLAARFAPPGTAPGRALAALDGAVNGFGVAYMVGARCVTGPLSVAACLALLRSPSAAPALEAARGWLAWALPEGALAAPAAADAAADAAALAGHAALALLTTSPLFPAFALFGVACGRWVERSKQSRIQ
jgi:hypothetical protein